MATTEDPQPVIVEAPPLPAVEKKVVTAGITGMAFGAIVTILNAVIGNSKLMGGLPPSVQPLVIMAASLLPSVVGYLTPHTPRPGTTGVESHGEHEAVQ